MTAIEAEGVAARVEIDTKLDKSLRRQVDVQRHSWRLRLSNPSAIRVIYVNVAVVIPVHIVTREVNPTAIELAVRAPFWAVVTLATRSTLLVHLHNAYLSFGIIIPTMWISRFLPMMLMMLVMLLVLIGKSLSRAKHSSEEQHGQSDFKFSHSKTIFDI